MKAVSGGSNTAILVAVLVAVLIMLSLVAAIWLRLSESPGPSVNTVTVTQTTTVTTTVSTTLTTTATTTEGMLVENIQIVTAYAEWISGGWKIILRVENTGTTNVSIDNIFINGKPWSSYNGTTISPPLHILVGTGSEVYITITIPENTGFSPSQMIEVRLHTASGKEYPKIVALPAEAVEIISAYATGSPGNWTITLQVKNVGTADAIIDNIFVNGKPYSQIAGVTLGPGTQLPIQLPSGETRTLTIQITGSSFSSGQMVEVRLHTVSGREYPKQVTLP